MMDDGVKGEGQATRTSRSRTSPRSSGKRSRTRTTDRAPVGGTSTSGSDAAGTPGAFSGVRPVGAAFLANGIAATIWFAATPRLASEFDTTAGAFGVAFVALGVGGIGGTITAPRLIGRFGRGRATVLAGFVVAATLALRALAPNLAWFVIAQLAAGIADGWQDVSMNDDAVRVDARARQPIINRLHGVWSIGTVIGALAGTLLAVLEAPSAVFFLTGALVVTFLNLATFPLWRDVPLRRDEPHADHPVPEPRVRVWTVRPLVLLAAMGIAVSVLEGSPVDSGALLTSPTRSARLRASRPPQPSRTRSAWS